MDPQLDTAHQQVVRMVVKAIMGLAIGLYAIAAILMVLRPGEQVPGELWLAAGNASGALIAMLVNTTSRKSPNAPATLTAAEQAVDTVAADAVSDAADSLVGVSNGEAKSTRTRRG